jgi:hypothetical protein
VVRGTAARRSGEAVPRSAAAVCSVPDAASSSRPGGPSSGLRLPIGPAARPYRLLEA